MGRYRAADLLRAPNLVSLARVPLAALFPIAATRPGLALLVLIAAGVSDIVDGWYARRFGQVTPTGTVVDPVTDKLFVGSVLVTLIVMERLPLLALPLLAMREIGELPLVIWWAFSRKRRRKRSQNPMANVPGKAATVLQFAAVVLALFESPHLGPFIWLTAVSGALAAAAYWHRELAGLRDRSGS